MTDIKYTREDHTLTVNGHASYSENGADIVCSAVSILCYTLAHNLTLAEEKSRIKGLVTDFELGNVFISCMPARCMEHDINDLFQYFLNGFKLLSKKYPNNVRVADL